MLDPELRNSTVTSLLAYSGLLHYAHLHHASLSAVVPRSPMRALGTFLSHLVRTILHPQFILFLPALVVHTPAYIFANLAARFLATPALPETVALSKVVGGGLGVGVGYAGATAALVRAFPVNRYIDSAWAQGSWGRVRSSFGTAVLVYVVCKVLAIWHRALIRGEIHTIRVD
jgi:glycerol-3-phosphate O-acyltransferase/dihydroxyacetone phosphate acyltransferase